MTQKLPSLENALKQHCLDIAGNIYTIGVEDVMAYIENELPVADPMLFAQLYTLDETGLALEIADTIGSTGIVELVENAIREAIKTQIEIANESLAEAAVEAEKESTQ